MQNGPKWPWWFVAIAETMKRIALSLFITHLKPRSLLNWEIECVDGVWIDIIYDV